VLPEGATTFPEYYDSSRHWSAESLARRAVVLPRAAGR